MIYLDNAATSFPKPKEVVQAMTRVMEHIAGNPGRGGHDGAIQGGRIIEECREKLGELLGVSDTERICFTSGCTDSLNTAIRGVLHQGDEVMVSPVEHNAVMRPLRYLEKTGQITVKVMPSDPFGRVSPDAVDQCITGRTALCILCHGSNVTGIVQDAKAIAERCRSYGVPLLLDAAQTAGTEDLTDIPLDIVALAGHKGLLGPMGTGALYVAKGIFIRPLRRGGTGSQSESFDQPEDFPDLLESGTANLAGIAGLLEGIKFVLPRRKAIRAYEQEMTRQLKEMLKEMKGVTVYDPKGPCSNICAFNIENMESARAAELLNQKGFALRGGLHCAPSAHMLLGTLSTGLVRASPGLYTTDDELLQLPQGLSALGSRPEG